MRALIITPTYPPTRGGVQTFVQRIVEHWPGQPPTVVTVGGPVERAYDQDKRGDVIRVAPLGFGGMPATMALVAGRAFACAVKDKPDIVLSAHVSASPAAVAMSLVGIPYIQFVYGTEMRRRPKSTRLAIRRAKRVLVISRYTAELAEELGAHPSQLALIEPGVDLPNVLKAQAKDRPTIVTVARMDDLHKGHDVMLDAVGLIRGDYPNIHWVAIGEGALRAGLERQAAERGLAENVTFLGAVPDRERDEWLDRAHVFAMPSRPEPDGAVEGYGIVYVEAGAHGLPVVGGDFAGPRDAVDHGHTGLLVDPTDPSKVAEAITRLLGDSELCDRLGRAGQEKARAQSWPQVARRLEAVARGVVGNNR